MKKAAASGSKALRLVISLLLLFSLCLSCLFLSCCGSQAPGSPEGAEDSGFSAFLNSRPGPIEKLPHPGSRYFGKKLSRGEQKLYVKLYEALAEGLPETKRLRFESSEKAEEIYRAVYYDSPELFWLTGVYKIKYTPGNGCIRAKLYPVYNCSQQQLPERISLIQQSCAGIIAQCQGLSDYEKVRTVYEFLINNYDFDLEYTGLSLYEFFSDRRGVCEGYARAMQYILQQLDMEVIYIYGQVFRDTSGRPNVAHAWNLVNIGGDYYHVDASWGDNAYDSPRRLICYDYLCCSDQDMRLSRSWDYFLFPPCSHREFNYYVMSGCYFEEFDRERLDRLFQDWLLESGSFPELVLYLRADSEELMSRISRCYFDEGGLQELARPIFTKLEYCYGCNRELGSIIVFRP